MQNYFLYVFNLLLLNVSCSFSISNCSSSCSILAPGHGKEFQGTFYPIACVVQNNECSNNSTIGLGNVPQKESISWNVISDKIALNFSWRPTHVSSFETLRGYKIRIHKTYSILDDTEELYFCLDTPVEYYKHVLGIFYYDCYGLQKSSSIAPGDEIHVIITSLPDSNTDYLHMEVSVPDCSDERLYAVEDCIIQRQLMVKVEDLFCENRTFLFNYNVPAQYSNFADLLFCQGEDNDAWSCITFIKKWSKMHRNGTLQYSIPTHLYDPNIQYTLSVWGSEGDTLLQDRTIFTFSQCSVQSPRLNIVIVLTFVIPIAIFVAILMLIVIKNFQLCGNVYNTHPPQKVLLPQSNSLRIKAETTYDKNKLDQKSDHCYKETGVCVYIVFVEDNSYHKEVVLKFASYLQQDLGFDVIFELWDQLKASENTVLWMDESMKKAHKIIIIWSPGAALRWDQTDKTTAAKCSDMFTPVLKQIYRDIFLTENLGKYFFVQFACYEDGICPIPFKDRINRVYILMEDFSELYFSLKDQEKYVPGGFSQNNKVDADQYFNPQINEVGQSLKSAIDDLQNLLKTGENWFESLANNDELPWCASNIIEEVNIRLLNIVPPLDLECPDSNCSEEYAGQQLLPTEVNRDVISLNEKSRLLADCPQNISFHPTFQYELDQPDTHRNEDIPLVDVNFQNEEKCLFHSASDRVSFSQRVLPCADIAPLDTNCDPMNAIKKINGMQDDS